MHTRWLALVSFTASTWAVACSGDVRPICSAGCASPGQTVCLDGAVRVCAVGADGCLDWQPVLACPSGACADLQTCASCRQACPAEGVARCAAGLLSICTADGRGCLGWSAATVCPEGFCADEGSCGHCQAGHADCNLDPADGCETPLGSLTDCAGCGDDCRGLYPDGQAACLEGACLLDACDPGFLDCNADPADGCEVKLGSLHDCRRCGDDCLALPRVASALCAPADQVPGWYGPDRFVCLFTCATGFLDCDGDRDNGCERAEDETSCGACGKGCLEGQVCRAGACEPPG